MGIYKRERITSRKIEIASEKIHCEDLGLYALSQNPNLEYSDDGLISLFSSDGQWGESATNTIIYTVSYLLINKIIELKKHNDNVSYLWGTFKNTSLSYTFKTCSELPNKDILTEKFLIAISNTHRRYKVNVHANAKEVVEHFISHYIYDRSSYISPEETFLVQVMKQYAKKHSWLSITSKPGFLNFFMGNNKVDITKIYLPRISMQMNELKGTHDELIKTNWEYSYFIINLKNYIKDYFSRLRN